MLIFKQQPLRDSREGLRPSAGGYLWSPKRNANEARNPFNESTPELSSGDIIFSLVDMRIGAIGVGQSFCRESPKPTEFGDAEQYWEKVGW